jgi:hypothetical protein
MIKKRLRLWFLIPLGLVILWLGITATVQIEQAYEAACTPGGVRLRCPSTGRHIFFLRLLVVACAIGLPWALSTLLADRDEK